MATDPPAVDLEAIRERWVNPLVHEHGIYRHPSVAQSQADVQLLLAQLDARAARLAAARAAFVTIRKQYGQVCDEYMTCTHRSCASSYGAWATADEWLANGAVGAGEARDGE